MTSIVLSSSQPKSGNLLSPTSNKIWRIVQFILWLIGAAIFYCLILYPSLGTLLFWNILIPVAPALLVVATGLWRNICPLATTNLLPRHFNLSKKKIMKVPLQGKLNLLAVVVLFLIVPLRHAIFNSNGPATAALLFVCIVIGLSMGFFFDWKSGWCSSLCPIGPVEKLYGENTIASLPNAHCSQCVNCSVPCPDSTPNFNPDLSNKTVYHRISNLLIIGGLPGFIFGWFHVPDHSGINNFQTLFAVYKFPLGGLIVTLLAYLLIKYTLPQLNSRRLVSFFAAAAVSCYYWFRIPALFGFGKFADDGLLINLKTVISPSLITGLCIALVIFFFWWLVFRKPNKLSWIIRPKYKLAK
ncbi:MAG: hypothetical protein ABL872_19785 [Lacibacter sp.]